MTEEYTDTDAIMGACWVGDQDDYLFHLLDEEDKAIAEKAAKLIIRDYGEVIKKLEEE